MTQCFAVISVLVAASAVAVAQTPSFTLIEPAFGNDARSFGISADGTAATGYTVGPNGGSAFHWTRAGGRTDFGLGAGMPLSSFGKAISGNGQYVAGRESGSSTGVPSTAF